MSFEMVQPGTETLTLPITFEFYVPVYPRTYEFLTTHPGVRGTCSNSVSDCKLHLNNPTDNSSGGILTDLGDG